MIFSTPVTPTRERLTRVAGARACTSGARLRECGVSSESAIGQDENSDAWLYSAAA